MCSSDLGARPLVGVHLRASDKGGEYPDLGAALDSIMRAASAALSALGALSEAAGVAEGIEAMFRGDAINVTEGRAVLHAALRQPAGAGIGGAAIESEVLDERARMLAFAESVRAGGEFDEVVHLGIGGSDLGPAMALQALRNRVGDATFWKIIHTWIREQRGGNGSNEEFEATAARVSGVDLSGFFTEIGRAHVSTPVTL